MNSRLRCESLASQIEPKDNNALDDAELMVQSATSSQLGMELSAALLRKAQSVEKVKGEAALELIESASVRSTNIDASSSKGMRIDTMA